MQTIRGAITAENTRESILQQTKAMLQEILLKNNVQTEDIISIHFTATNDLNAVYPAVSARELGITKAALFCMQEMYVENSLKNCIRCAITVDTAKKQSEAIAVYLGGAAVLRPDLNCYAVAIDGPAGSGKSSVAKEIAKRRQLIYVDTGAMYRTVGLYCQRKGIDTNDESAVSSALAHIQMDIKLNDSSQTIFLAGEDVTSAIRTQEAGQLASNVATISSVRQKLIELQRNLANGNSVIMDGRDIGTNVLPNAEVKIYLDASVEERAKRRVHELRNLGQNPDILEVQKQIADRDYNDKSRSLNPLAMAADSILLDTSSMDLEAVIEALLKIIDEKIKIKR